MHFPQKILVEFPSLIGGGGTMFCCSASAGISNRMIPEQGAATVNQAYNNTPDRWRNDVGASFGPTRH